MRVTVRLFAMLRQRAGADAVQLELADGACVGDALDALGDVTGGLRCVLAVNRRYAAPEQPLRAGDEIALIPPVSGGAAAAVWTRVTDQPLSLDAVVERVRDPRAGAVVTFSGVTRDVAWLDYEAYVEMAEPRLREIVDAAVAAHGLCAAAAEHRVGRVALSEASIVIAASAPHRTAAFAGAREIIDVAKATLPIWKAVEGGGVAGAPPA